MESYKNVSRFIARILVAALLVLNLNGIISYANETSLTPTLNNLEVSSKEVKIGDKLKVTADITDNGTEIYAAVVIFMKSIDDMPEIALLTYNTVTGKYQGKINIVSPEQVGEWHPAVVDVMYDTDSKSDNQLFVYNKNFITDEEVKDSMGILEEFASEMGVGEFKFVGSNGWENASYKMEKADNTAPEAPIVYSVSNKSEVIKGKSEPNAEIVATVDGEELGYGYADENGDFELELYFWDDEEDYSTELKAGTEISVTATDEWGNESEATIVKVLDKIPPTLSVNKVDDNDKVLSGKTEVGAVVSVKIGNKTYKATVDGKGNFKSAAIPVQKAGTSITVYSKDKAGNTSTKVVKVIDKTPPKAPIIYKTTIKSTSIKGTAEKGSTVYIKVGSKTHKVTTNSKGVYSLKISKQKRGTNIVVYAVDKAGNKGKSASTKVKSF